MKKAKKRKSTGDTKEQAVSKELAPYSGTNVLVNFEEFHKRLKQSTEDNQAIITASIIRQTLPIDKLEIEGQFELEEHCLDEPMRPLAETLETEEL